MKSLTPLLLLLITFEACQAIQGENYLQPRIFTTQPPEPVDPDPGIKPEDRAYYDLAYQGKCYFFIPQGGDGPEAGTLYDNDRYKMEPCKEYCSKNSDSEAHGVCYPGVWLCRLSWMCCDDRAPMGLLYSRVPLFPQ
jgi:hypothetical protein